MDIHVEGAAELADAARAHVAREDILGAIADLAASPLDQHASAKMRRALRRSARQPVEEAADRLTSSTGGEVGPARLAAVPAITEASA